MIRRDRSRSSDEFGFVEENRYTLSQQLNVRAMATNELIAASRRREAAIPGTRSRSCARCGDWASGASERNGRTRSKWAAIRTFRRPHPGEGKTATKHAYFCILGALNNAGGLKVGTSIGKRGAAAPPGNLPRPEKEPAGGCYEVSPTGLFLHSLRQRRH